MKKMAKPITAFILCFILIQTVCAADFLIPGGQVIGLQLQDHTVTVCAFDESPDNCAKAAGLKVGDRITKIDETTVTCAEDVRNALNRSGGTVQLTVLRNSKTKQLRLTPTITENGPKLGVYLKQGVSGIGTVSWYDPQTGIYGALGHSVNSPSGEILQFRAGYAYAASVLSVIKGKAGQPGQLMGSVGERTPIGSIEKNTAQGVFGRTDTPLPGEKLPVAQTGEIKTGSAYIRSTANGQTPQEYSVEILKIYPANRGTRNMLIKITDPELLEKTGGIVQGMSGSPIIQNGKLIGAVTHV